MLKGYGDIHKSVTILFYRLFYFKEQHLILDPLNELHFSSLHLALKEFINMWNNHAVRTAGHKSPQQLFTAGALLLQNSHLVALDFLIT